MLRMAQPWILPKYKGEAHSVKLRFSIQSEIDVDNIHLALEKPETAQIDFNGNMIDPHTDSWFTDKAIQIIALGHLPKGRSVLTVEYPFVPKTQLEWMYLLGDFGVRVSGQITTITPLPEKLTWCDWTTQGLPFYAGNVTYKIPFRANAGNYAVDVSQFRSPLLTLELHHKSCGHIAFAPYRKNFQLDSDGEQLLSITAFGSRINSFGQLHLADDSYFWFGPPAWRSQGTSWTDTYRLTPCGILMEPGIYKLQGC